MTIYYCITIIVNIVAVIVFYKNINVTGLSVMPLFLIALMIFQALIFRNEKVENGFRTAYGSNLTADEENKLLSSDSSFLFATIPWMIPFVLFFTAIVKVLSILVYIIGLVGGLILYRSRTKVKLLTELTLKKKSVKNKKRKNNLGNGDSYLAPHRSWLRFCVHKSSACQEN